ncbi:hypothetical protein SNOG_08690 [Parastagonospora nodorum SN15]|uniref:Vacuolar membrane-associated protein IML1 n=1 Tax=Phaeosphaeria nodorum (strain SN15 / ATCC MYA-4574 / FGSC 10173) TaxID=321614 RepID=Q0UHS4_PHANO|nr:hypothetical protein SNOG_08690 [Parastagonospora nodorum SN15]EAT83858.2 hypothetical protein SNOG_08690 [Parastagonospora nodorum SN15]
MWRMATAELSKRTVYKGQKLLFMGTIKATIKHIYINGHSVHSGYFSPRTRPVFRSESARYVLFLQMSKEMWDFDAEGAGEIMFNKVVGGFLPDLFKRWLRINARHLVTIILFTRMEYDGEVSTERSTSTPRRNDSKAQSNTFRDYYRVVVSDMASGDWINILYQLKKEFRTFLREVSIAPRPLAQQERYSKAEPDGAEPDMIVAGKPTSASQGNILEAINLAAAQFSKDYIDRVFEVDYNMLKLTTDTLMGSGIGIDLVCLSPMPLHSVPLFKYRTPRSVSAVESFLAKRQGERRSSVKNFADLEDRTPRQYESVLGSLVRTSSSTALHSVAEEISAAASENPDEWRFAMPYWVDVSFWSGTADDTLELTKPRKADRIVKRTRKKGRVFALRCRLYELQMMGVLENELGDISIPYLEEDPLYPHHMGDRTESSEARRAAEEKAVLNSSNNATGSYSSRGDRDFGEDHFDERSVAYKAWMEAYDDRVFSPVPQPAMTMEQRGRGDSHLNQSPELSRSSYLSTSVRSVEPAFGKTARPSQDATFHQIMPRTRVVPVFTDAVAQETHKITTCPCDRLHGTHQRQAEHTLPPEAYGHRSWGPQLRLTTLGQWSPNPRRSPDLNEDDEMETPKSRESLIRELIAFRLSHGFQIIVGSAVAEFSGRNERALASVLAPDYMSTDGDTVFMSVGNSIHQLVCVAGGEVEVKRYNRKPTTALEDSAGVDTPFPYKAYIRTAFEEKYTPRDIVLRPPRKEYNWNFIDTFLAGYHDELSDVLRFWRARFVLIPVEIPIVNRRPLTMLTEDSEEEIHSTRGAHTFQAATSKKQKDPNPLAIAYHTRDPSAVLAAGPDTALYNENESELQSTLFSETEKYHTSNIDLKKLAEDIQGEKGIQVLDRRWLRFWSTGFCPNFKDLETRDDAVELGNELMNKGLFMHVQKRHHFRDGNFFFQIAPEYRAPRSDSRTGWFGMRKSDKSVPSTPLSDGSSSSTSDSSQEGEKTPTRISSPKRKVTLSRVMRYDVDSRKRSYRPEIISLHYDRLHNPDNCYHIRIDWMNVTAKLIEDAIVTWATSVEKYGLKLVEVPISEVADIIDHNPFRSPYSIKLALQPPQAQPEAVWDSTHFSPQYANADKFAYHKALLRKLHFVLDMEAASAFPSDIDVTYSWGNPDYKYTQFIHCSGTLLAQITNSGNFILLANRLAHNRAKDNGRIRLTDPYEHKKATTDGSQSIRMPSTPAERANPHRSPFSSPLARPVQDASLLHTAFHDKPLTASTQLAHAVSLTPEQVKDELESFCSDPAALSAFYNEAFKQAPSPSPRILPHGLDDKIPSLGLPPAISIREASPAGSGWTLSSTFTGRGGSGLVDMHVGMGSGIAGRRQASETNMAGMGRRGSVMDIHEGGPRRQDSQGSLGSEGRK